MNKETKKIFQYDSNDSLIACVGSNGGTYDINIFYGYNESVRILYENIKFYEDIIVYPLVFSMRHVIELGLKICIRLIVSIPTFYINKYNIARKDDINKALNSHNLKNLFTAFKFVSRFNTKLKNYVRQYKDDLNSIKAFFFDKDADMLDMLNQKEMEKFFI